MKKTIVTTLALGVMLIAAITGCQKNTTLIIKPAPKVISKTVSFSKDLVPLFTKNCALGGCHADGGHAPDLMATKAYTSLMDDPDFVLIKDPENSTLYKRLTGKLNPAMPLGKPTNPGGINDLVLAWIKQGAKKN